MPEPLPESYVSVDIEAAGPTPREYALLSIGACLVDDPGQSFYVELKPTSMAHVEGALEVTGLSLDELAASGEEPADAMAAFDAWLAAVVPADHRPVFVGFNAAFDWMFVDDAFRQHLGRNPFGSSALDVKAYYMGLTGTTWAETTMRHLSPKYLTGHLLTHNALHDARDQAEIFRQLLAEPRPR